MLERRIGRPFFDRPTAAVARELLGTRLEVHGTGATRRARIVETEAYVARDPANHAWGGATRRNLAMFGAPGTLYVYRIHQVVCANLVTRPGQAVLLRAAAPLPPLVVELSGPGRLCRGLGITIADNGQDAAAGPRFSLLPRAGSVGPIVVGPRVGVRQAAARPLRFALAGEPAVSRPRPGGRSGG